MSLTRKRMIETTAGKAEGRMSRDGGSAHSPPTWIPVADHAVQRIQAMILDGALVAGDRLPSQRDLCTQLKISRTSLREALSVLEALGFIHVVPSRGAFVAQYTSADEIKQRDLQITDRFTSQEVYEFRLVHEGFAARQAALRVLGDEIQELWQSLRAMEEAVTTMDLASAAGHDFDFHRRIVNFSGNRFLEDIYAMIQGTVIRTMRLPLSIREHSSAPLFEHRQIIEALRAHDPDRAEARMREHIKAAATRAGMTVDDAPPRTTQG